MVYLSLFFFSMVLPENLFFFFFSFHVLKYSSVFLSAAIAELIDNAVDEEVA